MWIASTMSIAAYAVLKPRTTASDLPFVSGKLALLLDQFYDVRTMLMAMLVTLGPALLWFAPEFDRGRRSLFVVLMAILLAFEFAQIWIPTRGFGWPDVAYTVAGVAAVEFVVAVMQYCRRQWQNETGGT